MCLKDRGKEKSPVRLLGGGEDKMEEWREVQFGVVIQTKPAGGYRRTERKKDIQLCLWGVKI